MDGSSTSGESKPYSCCAGFAYYSQALAQRGGKPFCLGLGYTKQGQLRPDESQAIPQGTAEYKFVCIGFTAHGVAPDSNQGTPLLPYCEGIELITYVEGQQVARTRLPANPGAITSPSDAPGPLLGGQHQSPLPTALMSKAAAAATTDSDPSGTGVESVGSVDRAAAHGTPMRGMQQDEREHARQQQQHVAQQQAAQQQQQQQQQREQQQEDQSPPRPPFSERFQARIARNIASMQGTLRNEGPLRLRSFASAEELQARLWEVGANNCQRLNRAAGLAGTAIAERAGWAWQAVAARVAGGNAAGDSTGSGTARSSARE